MASCLTLSAEGVGGEAADLRQTAVTSTALSREWADGDANGLFMVSADIITRAMLHKAHLGPRAMRGFC